MCLKLKKPYQFAKFAKDNNVYFEFHDDLCYVKDKETRQVVLKGKLKDGLYQLELPHNLSRSLNKSSKALFNSVLFSDVTQHVAAKSFISIKDK